MRFETRAVHAGEEPERHANGDVVAPIHMSSTFARNKVSDPPNGYEYSRAANPTRSALENRLAAIEDGAGALAFASGLAAEAMIMFLLRPGDRTVACDDIYGGTFRLFRQCFSNFGMGFDFVDLSDPGLVDSALEERTSMLWIESPTNPLLKVYDIRALARKAHEANPESLVVVDNTFASPYFQRPLELGADLVVHSTTKYIGGHSDVIGGCLVGRDPELVEKLRFYQKSIGAVPGPQECFLTLRGIKTLHLRMRSHAENAMAVARFLEEHELVEKVNYPGLESHPQHELARRQMSGFSGMVSFELKEGLDPRRVVEATKVFSLAESLGGVESLIEYPSLMSHASIPLEERRRSGLRDGLIRLSVGIEAVDDLIEDLDQALAQAK
ncbi:MAG: PLP-dependent aspartate aminotransferase family protein [Methanomassiliicoccus sp.]|nr:PLP-dependent aspartate aminotransferase family protein [Methanomassiliicoccus sp.]